MNAPAVGAARSPQSREQAPAPVPVRAPRRVFVCFSTDWHGHPSTVSHLFKIIAQTERVIWVNSMGQRAPRLSWDDAKRAWNKLSNRARSGLPVADAPAHFGTPAAIVEPRVLPFHRYRWVRRLNRALLERQLAPLLRPWRAQGAEIIFVTTNPAAADLVGAFGATRSIYICMDEYAEMEDSDPAAMHVCEPLLLARVDRVFATALSLCRSKTNGRSETLHLPQGVDFEHFQSAQTRAQPVPLRALPRPIIGFQGIVGARVDLDLFEKILQRFPQASLVTVGRQEADLSRLQRYPNFHAFPAVPYSDLPRWIAPFDVGLIAYKIDAHTPAVNPLKLLEYLALGQAVVSVDIPEIARHRGFVELASSHEQYLTALARTLARYPFSAEEKQRRRRYAAQESWRQRAQYFLTECERIAAG